MFPFAITKNLNREILTKNLATFRRWYGVKDEKFQYYGGLTEKSDFQGEGSRKTNVQGVIALKGVAWTVCKFKRELGKKKGGGVCEGG